MIYFMFLIILISTLYQPVIAVENHVFVKPEPFKDALTCPMILILSPVTHEPVYLGSVPNRCLLRNLQHLSIFSIFIGLSLQAGWNLLLTSNTELSLYFFQLSTYQTLENDHILFYLCFIQSPNFFRNGAVHKARNLLDSGTIVWCCCLIMLQYNF